MSANNRHWLIYGANGYTGEQIARAAASRGLTPVLAGRNRDAVEKLAHELHLPSRVFELTDETEIARNLEGMTLVLHCAGPFQKTARPMAQAAIAARSHYLDITGEITVYEDLLTLGRAAEAANTMLMPGAGFDVVPTDCIATLLKQKMPDATRLELAFIGGEQAASGSLKTALRQMPGGAVIREAGRLKSIPFFSRSRKIAIGNRSHEVYCIPWGDVSTAFVSTGIPNIAVYTAFPKMQAPLLKFAQPLMPLLKNGTVLSLADRLVETLGQNPKSDYLETAKSLVWGEVTNKDGQRIELALETRDTYTVTIETALKITGEVLQGNFRPGFKTCTQVFGSELVFSVPGTRFI